MLFIISLAVAVALIVIVLTRPPISHSLTHALTHTRTHTSPLFLFATRSYQHAVPIKSCTLNLIKPLIYIKQPISLSTLECVSQGTLLPREGSTHILLRPQLPHFHNPPFSCYSFNLLPKTPSSSSSLLLLIILLSCLLAVVDLLLPLSLGWEPTECCETSILARASWFKACLRYRVELCKTI